MSGFFLQEIWSHQDGPVHYIIQSTYLVPTVLSCHILSPLMLTISYELE